ncbi:MAG: class B sortase [Lachnospiraceae bacterium]|nr:class B sortase [Lachnospiraceae bacterium]
MKYQRRRRLVRWFFLAGMVLCLIPIGRSYLVTGQHKAQRDALKRMVEMSQEAAESNMDNADMPGEALAADSNIGGQQTDGNSEPQGASEPAMLRKYAALYQENEDFVGWLSIEGTGIDYPVLQCEDDEYYLHHDFYGEDSKYGCLYVREQADLDGGTNFIIYGHNMRDGAMFGDLDLYLKESFFREHPTISFDTLYEERVYEIVAVFRSQVYHAEDEVFKYYQFYEADTREEFEDFYGNIKALSIYDTGVEAEFGDTFLTCSTCAYHVEDGRFVVVAKRRQE